MNRPSHFDMNTESKREKLPEKIAINSKRNK